MQQRSERLLLTGASGFVGYGLLSDLGQQGYAVRAAVRRPLGVREEILIGDINADTTWSEALRGIDCVIHLAGRAHVLNDSEENALSAYREINSAGTRSLAAAAAEAGIRRFIFVSSIKVNGEVNSGQPFTADDIPLPKDAYGISKLEAEQSLWQIANQSGMEVCIIRPPLVYGPGVKGNFQRLVRLVRSGIPLPFGAVQNHRSLVSVYNLRDLIIRCITSEAASGKVFLVSDGIDMSIGGLISRLGAALGCPARLIPVPPGLLRMVFTLLGRKMEFERLCGSLQVDIEETCRLLNWHPPVSVDAGLQRTVSQ
ncbi:MAG: SDR family oxidoreductase [Gammaproteobacteria bacterium]|nr:SDR family oxidoreductase [Gammaproteobacteria bacterium]